MKRERPAARPSRFLPGAGRSVCQVKYGPVVWGAPWARASSWWLDFSHGLAGVVQGSDPIGLTSQTSQSSRTFRITQDLQTINLLQRMYLVSYQFVEVLRSLCTDPTVPQKTVLPNTHFFILLPVSNP